MNKTNAHLYLSFVQALTEGKTIQILYYDGFKPIWFDCGPELNFEYAPCRYRVKPEPIAESIWLATWWENKTLRSHLVVGIGGDSYLKNNYGNEFGFELQCITKTYPK